MLSFWGLKARSSSSNLLTDSSFIWSSRGSGEPLAPLAVFGFAVVEATSSCCDRNIHGGVRREGRQHEKKNEINKRTT